MLRKILGFGGFTLLSRVTGFLRDVMLAAVMGAGPATDAFLVAFRLPNHFRAIFGEGAFNNAFVPAYAHERAAGGPEAARLFADRLFTAMLVTQLAVLALAWAFMPQLVGLLAPGFTGEPEKFALAVTLTRITFPYLLFVTLVTLVTGVLNARDRYAAGAAAPVLLNAAMIAGLALAFLFPDAAHAAAWAVSVSGALQLALVMWDARRAGLAPRLKAFVWNSQMSRFFRGLAPAVVGSAGVQLAMFADTVIATMLPTGAVSSIYFADRIYQLPVGVIGVAVGTVIMSEMSRRLAAGDEAGAHRAQNRAMALTLVAAAPFAGAFLAVPTLIMEALFARGAFTAGDAAAAGQVLAAYALGLPAIVLIRSAVSSFYGRRDTVTPLVASLAAVAVNVALKIMLTSSYGAPGLALATSAGAWVNLGLLVVLAVRRGWMGADRAFGRTIASVAAAAAALTAAAWLADPHVAALARHAPLFHREAHLGLLAVIGLAVYVAALAAALRLSGAGLAALRHAPPAAPGAAERKG
ncbi:murein biosynthesis integral membrane protein MurJ [Camelimonas abortus]|uniref:Probable lipid II flippase MurJ n=1 Tax=Camelimonas abortus TaxID=1017184 RepID=A0ABV7LHM6_9HYPH